MQQKNFDLENYPLQLETETIIKTAIDIHKILGAGFLEIVYKDAFEYENRKQARLYEREKEYTIQYKDTGITTSFLCRFCSVW